MRYSYTLPGPLIAAFFIYAHMSGGHIELLTYLNIGFVLLGPPSAICEQEKLEKGEEPDLDFYFERDFFFRPKSGAEGVKKNPDWHKGRQVRSNGVELHVL